MVGTGRIELPTSSVSRKRSPTELRACKTGQEWPQRVDLANPDALHGRFTGTERRYFETVQEIDFITNFSLACQPGRLMVGA